MVKIEKNTSNSSEIVSKLLDFSIMFYYITINLFELTDIIVIKRKWKIWLQINERFGFLII